MNNSTSKFLVINKNKVFVSYFVGFFIAYMIPDKYFRSMMQMNYEVIFSTINISEYDKYYKIN